MIDKINNAFFRSKRLKSWFGAGVGIGFNHPTKWWTEREYKLDETVGIQIGTSYLGYRVKTTFNGKGFFLKTRGGLSLSDKKGNERIILDFYYAQGLKNMIKYDVDYSYGYQNLPQYQKQVKGLRFANKGTYFGAFLGFPFYLKNSVGTKLNILPKANYQQPILCVLLKLGLQYAGMGKFTSPHQHDIKIGPPFQNFTTGLGVAIYKQKTKIALEFDIHNLGRTVDVINDSAVYAYGIKEEPLRTVGSYSQLIGGVSLENHFNYFDKQHKYSFFYGGGFSIALKRSQKYFDTHPTASYIRGESTYDNNYYFTEITSTPNGTGVFLNIKTGFAIHNKKGAEKFILELFFKQGLKTLQKNTVNYQYYYIPAPGGGNAASGVEFINRGSSFGFTGVIPFYFRLK